MSFKIVIELRAIADIQSAIDYYDSIQPGLGEKFLASFEKHLQIISEGPFFQILYKNYRGLILKEFHYYQIIFHVNEKAKTVYIDAIFHCAQEQGKRPK